MFPLTGLTDIESGQYGSLAALAFDYGPLGSIEDDPAVVTITPAIPSTQPITLVDGTTANYPVATVPDTALISTLTNLSAFTPASSPPTAARPLEPNEYWYDPYTETLILGSLPEVGSVLVVSKALPDVERDRIANPDPIFSQLPIVGPVELALSWEGHPSGSFTVVGNRETMPRLKEALSVGTGINIIGIGFRVASLTQTEYRQRHGNEFELAISLEGRWESPMDDPIPWRSSVLQSADQFGVFSVGGPDSIDTDRDTTKSIKAFCDAANIPYNGVDLTVTVPGDTTSEDSTTVASLLTSERVYTESRFLDLSNPNAIATPSIDGGNSWRFGRTEIFEEQGEITYAGIGEYSEFNPTRNLLMPVPRPDLIGQSQTKLSRLMREEPDIEGWAEEFPNMLLTGEFSEEPIEDESEDNQSTSENEATPQWKRRQPVEEEFEEGDPNPTAPPVGMVTIKDMSVLFSKSGPTKVFVRTTKRDGVTVKVLTRKYGFVFTADQVGTVDDDGVLTINANAAGYWRQTEGTTTTTLIDPNTGYILGSDTGGWTLTRFKEESDQNPETLKSDQNPETLSDAEIEVKRLYRFFQCPVIGRERLILKRHQDFYRDIRNADRYEYYKVTLPNGQQAFRRVENPNYVPTMFVGARSSETRALSSTRNPVPDENDKREMLYTGEERMSSLQRTIQSGSARIILSGDSNKDRENEIAALDRYTELSTNNTNSGEGFKDYAADKNLTNNSGRPGLADRMPEIFERIEPEGDEPPTETATVQDDEYTTRYFIRTAPYSSTDPIGGSTSISTARTYQQAQNAILTQAYINQVQSGTTDSLQVVFDKRYRPGDRVAYVSGYEQRKRIITGVKWTMIPLGDGKVAGMCTLDMGRDLDPRGRIEFSTDRVPNPTNDQAALNDEILNEFSDIIIRNPSFELGTMLKTFPNRMS